MAKGKKLRRENYPDLTNDEFEMMQEVNSREGEGPNF